MTTVVQGVWIVTIQRAPHAMIFVRKERAHAAGWDGSAASTVKIILAVPTRLMPASRTPRPSHPLVLFGVALLGSLG